jgi:anti-sigma B factor antagonist
MTRFGFETATRGAVALITLRGELDLHATADLEPELERLECETNLDVIALDLRSLDFLDSSGLRAILMFRDLLSEYDRRLVLVRGPQAVQRVFEITRMTERLEFVDAPEHVEIN